MKPTQKIKPFSRFIAALAAVFAILVPSMGWGQVIVAGSNTISCGTSYSFTDNGGAGNYIDNTYITYTICPSVPGKYVSVNFAALSTLYAPASGAGDHIIVLNGSTSTAPLIDDIYSLATITNGPTITSSAADGCLTFIWQSTSANGVTTGWNASVTCVDSPGSNTRICDPENCQGGCGTTICGTGTYTWDGDNATNLEELNATTAGCLSGTFGEMCNIWYYINPESTGTIDFNLVSNSGGDQDFAVWQGSGSSLQCPIVTGAAPIRCNFASMNASMAMPGTGVWGAWDVASAFHEASLTITATDLSNNVYYMVLVNTYNAGGACPNSESNITFGGTALLSCSPPVPLPVSLLYFHGISQGDRNLLSWVTNSERNNSHFTIEQSRDGTIWVDIGKINGIGNSNVKTYYDFIDDDLIPGITYYRLRQTDVDGVNKFSEIISISNNGSSIEWIGNLSPNPTSGELNFYYNGKNDNTPVDIKIYDNLGKVVYIESIEIDLNGMNHSLNLESLSNGVYRIVFNQLDEIYKEVIVINR